MKDIPYYHTFTQIKPINKGWSQDKKYFIENVLGRHFLLRVSDISEYDTKKAEFDLMKRMLATGIKMSEPIDFGKCNNGKNVYQLLTWCEGKEAKEMLPLLSEKEQYHFGSMAGQMMLKMQLAESYPPSSNWKKIYGERVSKYIKTYKARGKKLYGEELLLSFLEKYTSYLDKRPMALMHADFQSDNMVISPNKELFAIDFQGSDIVDPYYALTGVMVTAEVSIPFALGQLHSYFNNKIPTDFWELNAYYLAAESINAFSVAVSLGQKEIDYSNEMSKVMLAWLDNFNNLVPPWYQDTF